MPLQLELVLEDVSQDHTHQTVMIENHPHLQGEHASIHPCKHARVMNKIIYVILSSGAEPEVDNALDRGRAREILERATGTWEWQVAGIARDYVITRNATQVSTHAQKYFQHQTQDEQNQCTGSSIFEKPMPSSPTPPAHPNHMNNADMSTLHIPIWPIRPLAIRENPDLQRK
ncbi:Autophagy-related protein 3 [Acorus calamus]|uniref:Autophagy-related protein 3 n=1 Tax=Acorus calamus TaxID=4465 RepID=A0AAV9C4D5_ACOCL|nr:Autophagy-related protein 3 [Acorus calamus]